MRFLVALMLVGLLGRTARAEDIETETGTIDGYVIDASVIEPLEGVTVRIVGAALVMTVHADPSGAIHVSGLPPGRYRIEVERGSFSRHRPVVDQRVTIDAVSIGSRGVLRERSFVRCCICAMERNRNLEAAARSAPAAPPPLIDTHSTSVGIRLGRRELLGY